MPVLADAADAMAVLAGAARWRERWGWVMGLGSGEGVKRRRGEASAVC
jgi:hypothetical protein